MLKKNDEKSKKKDEVKTRGMGKKQRHKRRMSSTKAAWYCHCCGLKNEKQSSKCRVCGRPESYAQKGYTMPMHGKGNQVYRPSQVSNVLDNVYEADANGWTPLHTCCCNGNAPLVIELLKMEADVNGLTENGQTALHLAVYAGSIESVEALLNYGAQIDAATSFENNEPIHIAAERGWKKLMTLLIERGANPNALNRIERTPLHLVAEIGRVDMAAILIRAGSKQDLLDVHGWNARQVAELNSHREVEELLVRSTMKEKQAILKEMPHAPWHSELWTSLIETQKGKLSKHAKEMEDLKRVKEEVANFKKLFDEKAKQNKRELEKEQKVLDHWNEYHHSYVVDHLKPKTNPFEHVAQIHRKKNTNQSQSVAFDENENSSLVSALTEIR